MGNKNPIEQLKKEHEVFERLISEFGEITEDLDSLDVEKLKGNFNKLRSLWNQHEKKEEILFPLMEKPGFKIHVEKVFFDHKALRPHKDAIYDALESGNVEKIKEAVYKNSIWIIDKLKEHLDYENEYLFVLAEKEYSEEELKKMNEIVK